MPESWESLFARAAAFATHEPSDDQSADGEAGRSDAIDETDVAAALAEVRDD